MRVLIFLLLSFCTQLSIAQDRLLINYDTVHSLTAINHVVDNRGNIFVLSALQGFYDGPGTLIHGAGIFGAIVTKVDASRKVLWSRRFNISGVDNDARYPATELLLWDNKLVMPYTTGIGATPCLPPNTYSAGFKLGYLLIDASNGNVIEDKLFWEDSCGKHYHIKAYKTKNELHIFYRDYEGQIKVKILDASLKVVADRVLPFKDEIYYWSVFQDTFDFRYLVGTTDGIQVYDYDFNYVSRLPIPDLKFHSGTITFDIVVSRDKYVVSHQSNYGSEITSYLCIVAKNGDLLAAALQKHRTRGLAIDNDGSIWTSSQDWLQYLTRDMKKPIELKRMNNRLQPELHDSIGDAFYYPSSMSATKPGEVLVAGTSFTSIEANYPNKKRNLVFLEWYHFKPREMGCNEMTLLPNPAHSAIEVLGWNFGSSTDIRISNTLGQTMYTTELDKGSTIIRLPELPAGAYLITLKGSHQKCVKKFVIN